MTRKTNRHVRMTQQLIHVLWQFYDSEGGLTDEMRLMATWGVWGTTIFGGDDMRLPYPGRVTLARVKEPDIAGLPQEMRRAILVGDF